MVFAQMINSNHRLTDSPSHPFGNIYKGKRILVTGHTGFKGTRLPVEMIIEKIAYGATTADILKDYPFLTEDDIRAALLYAAKCVAHEEVYVA